MRFRSRVGLFAMAVMAAGCAEEKTTTTTAPTTDTGSASPGTASPDPQKPNDPTKTQPPPSPPPSPPPAGGAGGYFATVPGYSGTSGFVQFDIAGLYIEGREAKRGLIFISNAGEFGGGNWIYVKCLDTFAGRVVGSCKIEAEGQGAAVEGGYTGGTNFRRDRTYRFRVEWGGGQVRLLLDGALYASVGLARDVAITGLRVWINETPRSGPDPGYAGASIRNVLISGR